MCINAYYANSSRIPTSLCSPRFITFLGHITFKSFYALYLNQIFFGEYRIVHKMSSVK